MNDFLKIFFILCGLVSAFLFGRNYGEQTFRQSEEYQSFLKAKNEQTFAKNDIENAKAKFQNILDSAENKKSEELLGQILQVFLADLGLRIENQKNFVKASGSVFPITSKKSSESKPSDIAAEEKPEATKHEKTFNYKKMKSYEWILSQTQNRDDLNANLKNVEIRDIDSYLKNAVETKPEEQESIFGSYRGRILDVLQKEYGTLSMDIAPITEADRMKLKGNIKIFKNGKETSSKGFTTTRLGYHVEGSAGFILDNGNTFYQVYKISETQQIAGYFYERLVNGTTKTIGSFVLNRVDQF